MEKESPLSFLFFFPFSFPLPAWAESSSSPEQCPYPGAAFSHRWDLHLSLTHGCCWHPRRGKELVALFHSISSSNLIFRAQCCTCLILFPFCIYFILTATLKIVGVSFWVFGWLVSCFSSHLSFFPAGFCCRVLSPRPLNSLTFQHSQAFSITSS